MKEMVDENVIGHEYETMLDPQFDIKLNKLKTKKQNDLKLLRQS